MEILYNEQARCSERLLPKNGERREGDVWKSVQPFCRKLIWSVSPAVAITMLAWSKQIQRERGDQTKTINYYRRHHMSTLLGRCIQIIKYNKSFHLEKVWSLSLWAHNREDGSYAEFSPALPMFSLATVSVVGAVSGEDVDNCDNLTSATLALTRIYHWTVALLSRRASVITRSMCHPFCLSPFVSPFPLWLIDVVAAAVSHWQNRRPRSSDQYEEERDKKRSLRSPILFSPTPLSLPLPLPFLISRQNPRLLCTKEIESSRRRRQYTTIRRGELRGHQLEGT